MDANLIANEPTAALAPYTTNGIGFSAGTQGNGKPWCLYNDTTAVKAARGIVAASTQCVRFMYRRWVSKSIQPGLTFKGRVLG